MLGLGRVDLTAEIPGDPRSWINTKDSETALQWLIQPQVISGEALQWTDTQQWLLEQHWRGIDNPDWWVEEHCSERTHDSNQWRSTVVTGALELIRLSRVWLGDEERSPETQEVNPAIELWDSWMEADWWIPKRRYGNRMDFMAQTFISATLESIFASVTTSWGDNSEERMHKPEQNSLLAHSIALVLQGK